MTKHKHTKHSLCLAYIVAQKALQYPPSSPPLQIAVETKLRKDFFSWQRQIYHIFMAPCFKSTLSTLLSILIYSTRMAFLFNSTFWRRYKCDYEIVLMFAFLHSKFYDRKIAFLKLISWDVEAWSYKLKYLHSNVMTWRDKLLRKFNGKRFKKFTFTPFF